VLQASLQGVFHLGGKYSVRKLEERTVSKHRILAVDDHEPLLKAIRGILEEAGYTVFTALDGVKALEQMEKAPPDLILADIMMPRMDGYALHSAIRDRPDWVTIPFIFLTARAEPQDILKGKIAEDYLIKPFDPQVLVKAVNSRLKRVIDIEKVLDERFNKIKKQITTVLGHELRTPLTYVRGYTELALETESSTEELQDFLYGIKRGADRLNRLVEDLMLLVQIDTGRTASEFHDFVQLHPDLESVLIATIQRHKRQAADQSVTLELTVEPNLPPVMLYQPIFMSAVSRLISNAIKFSRGGEKRVTIIARSTSEWVEISISDQGVGIAVHEIALLFKRFTQIRREEMEQQGTGLGLALSKELVQLHNGEITVESVKGEGSTFTIRLPIPIDGE